MARWAIESGWNAGFQIDDLQLGVAAPGQNLAPYAYRDVAEVVQGQEVVINVAANDRDAEDITPVDPASIVVVDPPLTGEAFVNLDGTIRYVAAADAPAGIERFTYSIADEQGLGSNVCAVDVEIVPRGMMHRFELNGDETFGTNLWGNIVSTDRKLDYELVPDPGSSRKLDSRVAHIFDSTPGEYWYQAFSPAHNFETDGVTAISFWIRVSKPGGTVPIILKSGTGGEADPARHSMVKIAAKHIGNGRPTNRLSTDWQFVSIPIGDFSDGHADLTQITALQISNTSLDNDEQTFQPTGWDVEVWIDDLRLVGSATGEVLDSFDSEGNDNFDKNSWGNDVSTEESMSYRLLHDDARDESVGYIFAPEEYWYEAFNRFVDPEDEGSGYDMKGDGVTAISMWLRVPEQGDVVPIIIKSGTQAGQQSMVIVGPKHIDGADELGPEWRHVRIPLTDFEESGGQANFNAVTAIQIANSTNATGTFVPTGWKGEVWIDDLALEGSSPNGGLPDATEAEAPLSPLSSTPPPHTNRGVASNGNNGGLGCAAAEGGAGWSVVFVLLIGVLLVGRGRWGTSF